MSHMKLTPEQGNLIRHLAKSLNLPVRDVYREFKEHSRQPLNEAEQSMLELLRVLRITPSKLEQVIMTPVVNFPNVVSFLEKLPFDQLQKLFYAVHMSKLSRQPPQEIPKE